MDKVVFLDRDGTINKEIGYLHRKEDCEFIPKAVEAIRLLNENEFKVVVITNQAGVAKGYYEEEDVRRLHEYMQMQFKSQHAHIDHFCYCPFHPEGVIEKYRKVSKERKPDIGMFEKMEKVYKIDKSKSWMIGDSLSDIQAGKKFGIKTILVSTGYGKSVYESGTCPSDYYADDIFHAVTYILKTERGNK